MFAPLLSAHQAFVLQPGAEAIEGMLSAATSGPWSTPNDVSRYFDDLGEDHDPELSSASESFFVGGREALRGWSLLSSATLFGQAAVLAMHAGRTELASRSLHLAGLALAEAKEEARAALLMHAALKACARGDVGSESHVGAAVWLATHQPGAESLDALRNVVDAPPAGAAARRALVMVMEERPGSIGAIIAELEAQPPSATGADLAVRASIANAYFSAGQWNEGTAWLERASKLDWARPGDPDRDKDAPLGFFLVQRRIELHRELAQLCSRGGDIRGRDDQLAEAKSLGVYLPSACPNSHRPPVNTTPSVLAELARERLAVWTDAAEVAAVHGPPGALARTLLSLRDGAIDTALEQLLESQQGEREVYRAGVELARIILREAGGQFPELARRWQVYL